MLLRLLRGGLAGLWMLGMLVGCGGGRTDPHLSVQLAVDGTAVDGSTGAGETATLSIQSGQTVSLQGNLDLVVVASAGDATIRSQSRTDTTWSGIVESTTDTSVTLSVTSRDDPDQTVTVTLNVSAIPLAMDVVVDDVTVSATPVGAGDDYTLTIRSGQTLAFKSNLAVDFSSELGDVKVSDRLLSSSTWKAALTSASTSEVVITATVQGDSSRVATLHVQITPTPLQVSVLVDGTAVNSTPLLAGEATTVNLDSGQTLTLNTNVSMTVNESLDIATRNAYVKTATSWSARLSSTAPTVAVLEIVSAGDSSQVVTVNVVLDQVPLSLNFQVTSADGSTVLQTDTVNAGEDKTYTVSSGSRVALGSPTIPMEVNADLGDALTRNMVSTSHSWGALVATTTATEAVLVVTPQGTTSGGLTVRLQITP